MDRSARPCLTILLLICIFLLCPWSGAVHGQVNFQMEVRFNTEVIELDAEQKETKFVSAKGTVKVDTNEPGKLNVFLDVSGGDINFGCDVEPTMMEFMGSGSLEFRVDCTVHPPSGTVEVQSSTVSVDAEAVVGTVKPRTYHAEDGVLILVRRKLPHDDGDGPGGGYYSSGPGLMFLVLTAAVLVLIMASVVYLAHRRARRRRKVRVKGRKAHDLNR